MFKEVNRELMKKESTKLHALLALRGYVLKCQRVLRAYVPCVPACFACLRANVSCVLTYLGCLRACVPMYLACSRANVPCVRTCSRVKTSNNKKVFNDKFYLDFWYFFFVFFL